MRFIVASGILLLVGVSLTACGSKSTDDIDYKGSEVAPTAVPAEAD